MNGAPRRPSGPPPPRAEQISAPTNAPRMPRGPLPGKLLQRPLLVLKSMLLSQHFSTDMGGSHLAAESSQQNDSRSTAGFSVPSKPPPLAPPPKVFSQTVQRPAVQSVRGIEPPKLPLTGAVRLDEQTLSIHDGRIAPPRGVPTVSHQDVFYPSKVGMVTPEHAVRDLAGSKFTFSSRPGVEAKPGGIDMFSSRAMQTEPAEKKQMTRAPRPLPPAIRPSWIPIDQPVAPVTKADGDKKIAPPPVRIAPNRSRAPPGAEPHVTVSVTRPAPPLYDSPERPPKTVEGPAKLHRLDKSMPEFESSSDEEVVLADQKAVAANPPVRESHATAWGEPAVKVSLSLSSASPRVAPLIIGSPDAKAYSSARWSGKNLPSPQAESVDARASSAGGEGGGGLFGTTRLSTRPTIGHAPSVVRGAWGDSNSETESKHNSNGRGARPSNLKLQLPVHEESVFLDGPHGEDGPGLGLSPNLNSSMVWDRPNTAMSQGPAQESFPDSPVKNDRRFSIPQAVAVPVLVTSKPALTAEDIQIGKDLPAGRFSITCIEGFDFYKSDVAVQKNVRSSRIDPYIKFRVGLSDRHSSKATRTQKRQDENPKFENEVVSFDILSATEYVCNRDIQLVIEVWNKGKEEDDLLGTTSMSLLRFLRKPYRASNEGMPLFYPEERRGGEAEGKQQMRKLRSRLSLKFLFEEARVGIMSFTLIEGNGLRNLDPSGQQNPYLQLSSGDTFKKRSKTIKDGGTKPYFSEEEILFWIDGNNWVNDVKLDIFDENVGSSKPIGSCSFSPLPFCDPTLSKSAHTTFELSYKVQPDPNDKNQFFVKSVPYGEVTVKIVHYPAGVLNVLVNKATSLQFPRGHYTGGSAVQKRIDPYVVLSLPGKAVNMVEKTSADKDGGSNPVWGSNTQFRVVDQYLMDVEVFHQNILGVDVLLGAARVSLLPAFRTGLSSSWCSLSLPHDKANSGGVIEQGDVSLTISFTGPAAVAYPQMRQDVTSYDDSDRLRHRHTLLDQEKDASIEAKQKSQVLIENKSAPSSTLAIVRATASAAAVSFAQSIEKDAPPEFTEAEIVAAFKFIDLDHNNYVGAKEIRHILVCMGELITDEEVDMMISMVDLDGDGQVSFLEFRTLVLHPSPHTADLHKEVKQQRAHEESKDKILATETSALRESANAGAGGVGLDFTAFKRQREMKIRESKKKLFVSFVADNDVNFEYVKSAHQNFLDFGKEQRVNGKLSYPDFCSVCAVEPIAEYRRLYDTFDIEQVMLIDFREFLLSLLNFITVDKELRVQFSFAMFDEGRTGFITQREVEEILRGNHMIGLSSVQRKADTIMRQAKSNSQHAITMSEFVIVSKKFPNILLPSIGVLQPSK